MDEPITLEYKDDTTRSLSSAVFKAYGDKRISVSQILSQQSDKSKGVQELSPENQERPITPPIKTSPPTSLSSPFPMQFRSHSFNASLPSQRHKLKKETSSPDLDARVRRRVDSSVSKGTIESSFASSAMQTSPNGGSRRAEKPPPCPGARRAVPLEKGTRRPLWRNKSSIRSTSIVDNDEDDDYSSTGGDSTEEELIG